MHNYTYSQGCSSNYEASPKQRQNYEEDFYQRRSRQGELSPSKLNKPSRLIRGRKVLTGLSPTCHLQHLPEVRWQRGLVLLLHVFCDRCTLTIPTKWPSQSTLTSYLLTRCLLNNRGLQKIGRHAELIPSAIACYLSFHQLSPRERKQGTNQNRADPQSPPYNIVTVNVSPSQGPTRPLSINTNLTEFAR